MSITAQGMFGLTLEKMFIDTMAQSMEAETHKYLLDLDTDTPNFDTWDFRADVANEVPQSGNYTTGGVTLTTTEWTVGSPSAGVMKWDFDDPQWANSTIANAMAGIAYFNVGSAATDALILLQDFVTAASTNNGLFLVQVNANGAVNLDYTP